MIATWLMLAAHVWAAPASQPAQSPVVSARVTGQSESEPVVRLNAGRGRTISAGDACYILSDQHVTAGEVIVVGADESGARLNEDVAIDKDREAVILRHAALAVLSEYLPLESTISGRVARLVPGRATAWIDIGARSGIAVGRQVLVRREVVVNGATIDTPIARGEVLIVEAGTSLVSLQPVVGNAVTQRGDRVELWPSPGQRRLGRLDSAVLEVKPDPKGAVVTLIGSEADGFEEGRLVDIYRADRFVACASVIEPGSRPLSKARVIDANSVEPLRPADAGLLRAILRAPPGPPVRPLRAPIFRVEGDYCLVAAGEVDGVSVDEKLIVHRTDPNTNETQAVFAVTLDQVKVDYAGGNITRLDPVAPGLAPWEFAERQTPPWPRWQSAGIVVGVDAASNTLKADVDPKSHIKPGDLIELIPDEEGRHGAAVVLWRSEDRCIAGVPRGWADLKSLPRAQVRVPEPVATDPPG